MGYTTVFIVSEDAAIGDSVAELVISAGMRAEIFASPEQWLENIPPERKGCLVLDTKTCGFASLVSPTMFAAICAQRPVLLLIDRGDVPIAVRALKHGAVDVLEKPCSDVKLLGSIERAVTMLQHTEVSG